jgi:alpha-beta hydrolase superfamily lysophospholipase
MTTERTLQMRADAGLLGILTQPPPSRGADIGCVLMNAGVIHRIGPHRLNVKLARELATHGVSTIRLDLSGVGDSRPEGSTRSFTEQAVRDIRCALDELQRVTGLKRFVISGLCSGAAIGFRAALADPRIVALQMLDPYAYPTRRANRRYYAGRMRLPEAWGEAVGNLMRKAPTEEEANGLLGDFMRDPPAEEFAKGLATLIQRGVAVMCLYTGSILQIYNYVEQFDEVMEPYGIAGRIRVEHMPDSTHTFLDVASQRHLIDLTVDWVQDVRAQLRDRP